VTGDEISARIRMLGKEQGIYMIPEQQDGRCMCRGLALGPVRLTAAQEAGEYSIKIRGAIGRCSKLASLDYATSRTTSMTVGAKQGLQWGSIWVPEQAQNPSPGP
jgi:hypothetical protein